MTINSAVQKISVFFNKTAEWKKDKTMTIFDISGYDLCRNYFGKSDIIAVILNADLYWKKHF